MFRWSGQNANQKSWVGQNANHRKKSGQYANLWLALCPVGILSGWHFVLPPSSRGEEVRIVKEDETFNEDGEKMINC